MLQDISTILNKEYTPPDEYVLKENTQASPPLKLEEAVSHYLLTSQID
jgi:hypothetical protein